MQVFILRTSQPDIASAGVDAMAVLCPAPVLASLSATHGGDGQGAVERVVCHALLNGHTYMEYAHHHRYKMIL